MSSAAVVKSAASAYRADLAGHRDQFGAFDHAWITLATLLEHAALVPVDHREELLRDAIELAREIVGETELHRLGAREFQNRDRTPAEAIVLAADAIHAAGALNLAAVLFDALAAADTSLNVVQRGRILYYRARVALKQGEIDEALFRYRQVETSGRDARRAELVVRGLLGMGAVAQMRGNYPQLARRARRAAALAERAGLVRLASQARAGLMIEAANAHRFDEALVHAWYVYEASTGDAVDEGEILSNIGQLLLEAGHVHGARAAFASVVSRALPVRILLPALGGLAISSGASDDVSTLDWAVREIERIEEMAAPRYPVAEALLECATALAGQGRPADAERCRKRALKLAVTHGFHEVAYKADAPDPSAIACAATATHAFRNRSADIAREVVGMEPKRLPSHVAMATASY